jgi:phage gpG-like protein
MSCSSLRIHALDATSTRCYPSAETLGKKGINRKGQTLATAKRPLIGLSKSLMSQFHMHAVAHSVTVSNTMIYAAIQQFGGQAGRGKKVRIPARPFLPVRLDGSLYPQEQAKILELLNGYLMAC